MSRGSVVPGGPPPAAARRAPTGVVMPSASGIGRLRPLDAASATIGGGLWAERIGTNRTRTMGHGLEQLERSGEIANLRMAAGAQGTYQALTDSSGYTFPFVDTDVYKWLEAVGWELGRGPDPDLEAKADAVIEVVRAAQRPDGYIDSFVQVVRGGVPYQDLPWGHEFYCVGHLVQAAIAWQRRVGDDRLLDVARRAVDHIDRAFGPSGRDGIDGHPEIEMALVELWRTTGERRDLDLAARFIDLRGHGLLGDGRFGREYWQDHAPVRTAPTVAGHAVRQLYLDAGAVDVAVETGDRALLDAVIRRWTDMVATRRYVTGGLGSRHRDEAFGEPFELPPAEAYAETCASIASVMLAWRLLLATGEPRFADAIERTMHNGFLSGLSRDGTHFFYVNPLERRASSGHGEGRAPWYPCACCPPNVMRTLSTWEQYLATTDDDGLQIHQLAAASLGGEAAAGAFRVEVETGYPWDGAAAVRVVETPVEPWTLSIRIPPGARSAVLTSPDGESTRLPDDQRTAVCRRSWRPGDVLRLAMDLPVTIVAADRRVRETRGTVAIERGPIVYCVEAADLPAGVAVEDVTVDAGAAAEIEPRSDLGDGYVGVTVPARTGNGTGSGAVRAIPYFTWGNRGVDAMRVWLPTRDGSPTASG